MYTLSTNTENKELIININNVTKKTIGFSLGNFNRLIAKS